MSLPQPLMFTVGLIDQITKPIAKISNKLNGLASNYQAGTMQMASGIGGVAASGYALQNALMPAIEMDRALGEVASLGVRDSALKMLSQNSYEYALKYGESAVDFVRSSYDIQSAIAGLNDADLSRFTMASNVLAKGTKADAATITNYMGTMYGIFNKDAAKMGQGKWVEQLTGMTATAVQLFKTDGKKMADAFSGLGAAAGNTPLAEQMAVLGSLQAATNGGGEAATQYKSFLAGVGKAQKALGLTFVDSNDKMLPIIDILEKIKAKYGDVSTESAKSDIRTAFGGDQALGSVQYLINNMERLRGSIDALGKVNGMEQAEKMAAAMTDQSQRLAASWFVIRAAFGSAILPAFNGFVGKIADMGRHVLWFTDMFPNITRWLGYMGIGFMLAVAAGGVFTLMMGAVKMVTTTFTAVMWLATAPIKALTWAMKLQNWQLLAQRAALIAYSIAFKTYFMLVKAGTAAVWLYNVGSKAVIATTWLFTGALAGAKWAMAALNAVMFANPIGLVIAGIAAAAVAVGALIYYWDDLKATMSEWGWIQALGDIFSKFWNGIKEIFTSAMSWIIDKLSYIGIDIKADFSAGSLPEFTPVKASTGITSINAIEPVKANIPRGGISQQIANANNSKSTTVGAINVYPQKVDSDFANFVEMHS